MAGFVVRVGGFYVNDSKGLVREVTRERDDGKVFWRSYNLTDGRPTGDSLLCEPGRIAAWANREATPEEVARMQSREGLKRESEREIEMVNFVLSRAPDELLIQELRRRGHRVV